MEIAHVPVMLEEVVEGLNLKSTGIYVDATLGLGGHSKSILEHAPGCILIGIDRDERAIELASERLKDHKNTFFVRDRFSNMKAVVNSQGHSTVSGILIDAGVSSLHLKSEGRGFSFLKNDPLDMRMDLGQKLTAAVVVNKYSEKDLADIIWKYGEERHSRRIARTIINARRTKSIKKCDELAALVERAVRRRGRIHPATRTFQALRIEVNEELQELSAAIEAGAELLGSQGRFCILSYHSLEDRIVKNAYKKLAKEGIFNILTKRPLVPNRREVVENPSSRSAKLRVGEKI
jgi:16S rRNA (cytosine1402-N4)-methyltransferase